MLSTPGAEAVLGPAVATYPPGSTLLPRVLQEWELMWVLSGVAELHLGDGVPIRLEPGSVLLLGPDLRHRFVWDPNGPTRHGYVHLSAARLARVNPTGPVVQAMSEEGPLPALLRYLLWLSAAGGVGAEEQISQTLDFVLGLVLGAPAPQPSQTDRKPAPLEALAAALRRRWSDMPLRAISVAQMGAASGVSPSHLTRLFREHIGCGPGAFEEAARLTCAQQLLTRTSGTVASVARNCGFADASHLSHRFARRVGCSPDSYRHCARPGLWPEQERVRHAIAALWLTAGPAVPTSRPSSGG